MRTFLLLYAILCVPCAFFIARCIAVGKGGEE